MTPRCNSAGRVDRKGFLKGCLATGGALLLGRFGWTMGTRGEVSKPVEKDRAFPKAFVESARFDSGVEDLRGVAWAKDGKLYAGGKDGVAVLEAASDGSYKKKKTLKTAKPVTAVAVDAEGDVYAAMRTGVVVFGADGTQKAAWGERGEEQGQFRFITGIAVDSPVVAVADAGRRTVLRFAVNGDLVDETKGFHVPSPYFDLAYDKAGNLHVANPGKHRVEIYDPTMTRTAMWGTFGAHVEGFAGCCNPTNLTILESGQTVTTEKGLIRLKMTPSQGKGKVEAWLGPDAFTPRVAGMDLAAGPDGRFVLADVANNELRIYAIESRESKE